MKIILSILSIAIVAVLVFFIGENMQRVAIKLFGSKTTLPLSFMIIGVYVLGALTGSMLSRLLRKGLKNEED